MFRNPLPDLQNYEFGEIPFKKLMQNRIYNVLIVCSNYDYYLLEEDGRIDELIFEEYSSLNLRYPPNILHANSTTSALEILDSYQVELVISWLDIGRLSFEMSNTIKKKFPNTPIVALSHYPDELQKLLDQKQTTNIDYVFHWNGNTNIFLAIIKVVEDSINAENDINEIGVKAILLVEDSIRFYSRYLPLIYKILFKQTQAFEQEGLNEHRKIMSKRSRPKILLAKTYEEAIGLFNKYKNNLLGAISDVTYLKNKIRNHEAGFHFLEYVRKGDIYFPVIIQSSNKKNKSKARSFNAEFLHKQSETLGLELKNHITKYFSFGDFEFWNPKKNKVIKKAKDLKIFQKALASIPIESIVYHSKRNDFSKWLRSRALFPLANLF